MSSMSSWIGFGCVRPKLGLLPVIQMNGWHSLGIEAPESMAAAAVDGVSLFVANVDGTLLAYRNSCAECGGSLDGGVLEGPIFAAMG